MAGGDRPTVLLIGLGNIGFRHLQGLASMAMDIRLVGVDLNPEAVKRASAAWLALPGAQGVFTAAVPNVPTPDLAIVATSARGRDELTLGLLGHDAKKLVLEKVVFDRPEAFARVQDGLDRHHAQAFVNCPRRLWPIYQRLESLRLQAGGPIHLTVSGRALGFACNAVHFIDLLQFLSGESDVTATAKYVSLPWPSKRAGFFEVWCDAKFSTPGGATLHLTVTPDAPETAEITAELSGDRISVTEAGGLLVSRNRGTGTFGRAPFQSELSALFSAPLLLGREPSLPSLSVSAKAHRALFDVLIPSVQAAGLMDDGALPIT